MVRPSTLARRVLVAAVAFTLVAVGSVSTAEAKHHEKHQANANDSDSNQPPAPGASTLVNVQIVSRHGTRAPNPVVDKICPTDRANLARYADLRLTLAGLTGTGQKELYALGVFTRQTYIERAYPHFISEFFNDEEVYFRAVGEDRTIQSAVCMGQGMFPQGTAAIGYFSDLPSPVPIYTIPDDYDSLLEVRKHDCATQLKKDAAKWDEVEGIKLYQQNEPLIERLLDMCNITDLNDVIVNSGDNYGDAIKDITDAWTFDMIEGFPPQEGLNYSSLLEFRTLALTQLLGRIVGTEEQITYMNGELPERLLDNFHTAIVNQGPKPISTHHLKMYAYHGHREMMYALGAFLGIDYDIKFPGLPKGAIPPATTLFFELHYIGERINGTIPNAYDANGVPNPYRHRMVPEDELPPVHHFGEPAPAKSKSLVDAAAAVADAPAVDRTASIPPPAEQMREKRERAEDKQDNRQEAEEKKQANQDRNKKRAQKARDDAEEQEANRPAQQQHVDDAITPRDSKKEKKSARAKRQAEKHQKHGRVSRRLLSSSASSNTIPSTRLTDYGRGAQGQRRHGEDELNGVGPQDRPVERKTPTAPPKDREHRSVLPRASPPKDTSASASTGAAGPKLVRIPDRRMPDPPMKDYVVRAFIWHPCGDEAISEKDPKKHAKHTADCPAVAVKMTAVCDEYQCSMQDFRDKMDARVQKTGTWAKLCGVPKNDLTRVTADVVAAHTALVDAEDEQVSPHARAHTFRWFLLLLLVVLIYAGVVKYRQMTASQAPEYVSFSQRDVNEQTPLNRIY